MARIEISLDEYDSLKNKKKDLETIIGKQKQEIASKVDVQEKEPERLEMAEKIMGW